MSIRILLIAAVLPLCGASAAPKNAASAQLRAAEAPRSDETCAGAGGAAKAPRSDEANAGAGGAAEAPRSGVVERVVETSLPGVTAVNVSRPNSSRGYYIATSHGSRAGATVYLAQTPDGGGANIVIMVAFKWAVAAAAALAAFALALAAILLARARRRRVNARAVAEDRKRMAGDLHDTIEQHLAAIKLTVNSILRRRDETPPETVAALEMVNEMLASAKAEVRTAVMNLRSDKLRHTSLADALAELAGEFSASGAVSVRCRVSSLAENLSATEKMHALAIAQEAVTNAVRHGNARKVLISARRLPTARAGMPQTRAGSAGAGFTLAVMNDGAAFDPEKALGPATGHFGLSGMRERAVKLGGRLEIASRNGVTTVRLEVRKGVRK